MSLLRFYCYLTTVIVFPSCAVQPGYYWHLFRGQANITLGARPLEEVLDQPNLTEDQRTQLVRVAGILRFAQDILGYDTGSSYTTFFDTGDGPVSWNVSACSATSFEAYQWNFPIVGAMPYKGFFDRVRAEAEQVRLEQLGYDTLLRPVTAYSTLGLFSDPVLSAMLKYSEAQLADLLLHELTHKAVFAKGHGNFNESLATYVGRQASLRYLVEQYGPASDATMRALQERTASDRFTEFLKSITNDLNSLYTSGSNRAEILRQRERIFERAQQSYRHLRSLGELADFDTFLSWRLNNARLLSYHRYHSNLNLFAEVHQQYGSNFRQFVAVCRDCASTADPWNCMSKLAVDTPAVRVPPASSLEVENLF